MDGQVISFGPFRLLTEQRLLLEGDRPVRLGSRAFDILAALAERPGEVIGKDQLIARVWPQTPVEDANLKIQMSALRRALGDGQGGNRYVITVPGRGYNFVAPVRREEPSPASPPPTAASAAMHNLPFTVTRMIGRDDTVAAVISRLSRERLVTLVGPGGVGKTTVALAVAERMISDYEHGVRLVDLAPLGDSRLVASAAATVLGLEMRSEDPLPGLVAALRDDRMVLLLDNCEHVVEGAAGLAAAVLSGAPGVKILATSREPLGVAGEHEHRLRPLTSPELSSTLAAAEAAAFPAVQLFVERVTANVEDFALTDANARLVAEVCRRLDGLPLAIEFAAPRVQVLGLEGLAARLRSHLAPWAVQRRGAMPRHRTMRAVIDWSYGLLSTDEQQFFRALGIFTGGFTVEAAAAIAMNAASPPVDAIDPLADLVAKSLVVADVGGTESRFRLLDTTRAYATGKLDESGERERLARRHAEYYHDLFERAEGEERVRSAGEWLADYACEIDNLRAALDWAFSPGGDGSIGVALTAAAVPLWMRLSLFTECHSRAKQALGSLGTGGRRAEMKLHAALGTSLIYASRVIGPEIGPALTSALEIAESLGDAEYQLRSIWGLWGLHSETGRYRVALPFAQKFHDLAMRGSDSSGRLFGERMMGSSKHFLGDQIGARRHLEQVLAHYACTDHGWEVIRFGTDLRVAVHALLARVLWLQGFADQAVRTAETSIAEAQATGHAASLCYALATAACPIALWVGNLTAAARHTSMLLDDSRKHGMPLWSAFGSRFQGLVALRSGDLAAASRLLQTGLDSETADPDVSFRFSSGLSELAGALTHAGRVAEALALVETAIEQVEAGWAAPELLRLKGELLLLQKSAAGAQMAQDLFRQALDEARQQGALSWELRAATSLARLLWRQGQSADAIACLQPVYDRFTESFGTADLIAAQQVLDGLSDVGHR
jgi:predicted ATPase/DNA-binding winged helix-turn-helix (wHTH) protein